MRRTKEQLQEEMIKYRVYEKDGKWFGFKNCPECKKELRFEAQKSYLILRNLRNAEEDGCLCGSCNKKGDKNHFFGKNHTKESIEQISISRTGKGCCENSAMAKKETREKVSNALKIRYASGDLDFLKKIQSDNAIKNQANGKIKNAPISKAEKEIKILFDNRNIICEQQFRITSLKYDFYLPDYNVLIEYNGDYWHCNPEKYSSDYFNQKKGMFAYELWAQDKRKKELAEKNGHKLFTIWEKDFILDKNKEINKIIDNL